MTKAPISFAGGSFQICVKQDEEKKPTRSATDQMGIEEKKLMGYIRVGSLHVPILSC